MLEKELSGSASARQPFSRLISSEGAIPTYGRRLPAADAPPRRRDTPRADRTPVAPVAGCDARVSDAAAAAWAFHGCELGRLPGVSSALCSRCAEDIKAGTHESWTPMEARITRAVLVAGGAELAARVTPEPAPA
jgi:hypothetical protein